MDIVAIPGELLLCDEYAKLPTSAVALLVDLYAMFGDCECFTIDFNLPGNYRQQTLDHQTFRRHFRYLESAELIQSRNIPARRLGFPRRIFTFKYKVIL